LALLGVLGAPAQDARDLVRRSIAQNQTDWLRMKDYTWQAQSVDKNFDSHGNLRSVKQEKWETLILDGQPHRRILERDNKPLSPQEQRVEQKKLDDATARLSAETPAQRQSHFEETEKRNQREFAFLSEIPDLFNLHLDGEATVEGRPVWIVSGAPRPGAQPKSRDGRLLLNVRGRMWIDQATYQWAKVEVETTGVISWGLFLARLNAGAHLTFEQAPVSDRLWLPEHLVMGGSGRLGLIKRIAQSEDVRWSNYRKFSVESKVVTGPGLRN
jgi:hypothetical protein